MKKIHTHYDNLRISRNAPREVIRAAYKALSQKYHPDKSQRPDADTVMAIINRSYAVLSDDRQRRKHDAWIAAQEQPTPSFQGRAQHHPARMMAPPRVRAVMNSIGARMEWCISAAGLIPARISVFLAGLILLSLYFSFSGGEEHALTPGSRVAASASHDRSGDNMEHTLAVIAEDAAAGSARARLQQGREKIDARNQDSGVAEIKRKWAVAPDGFPWPLGPRIYREDAARKTGLSTVTIDNSRNAHAVHVKLGVEAESDSIAREFYIPRHRMITLEYLSAGVYYIKYRDLASGRVFRSADFRLKGEGLGGDAQYSNFEMALHTVNNGKARFMSLADSEF